VCALVNRNQNLNSLVKYSGMIFVTAIATLHESFIKFNDRQ